MKIGISQDSIASNSGPMEAVLILARSASEKLMPLLPTCLVDHSWDFYWLQE